MRPDVSIMRLFLFYICFSATEAACEQISAPTLAIDVSSGPHGISRDIYSIANGVDATFAKEIQLALKMRFALLQSCLQGFDVCDLSVESLNRRYIRYIRPGLSF